jgi:hypothetical protein
MHCRSEAREVPWPTRPARRVQEQPCDSARLEKGPPRWIGASSAVPTHHWCRRKLESRSISRTLPAMEISSLLVLLKPTPPQCGFGKTLGLSCKLGACGSAHHSAPRRGPSPVKRVRSKHRCARINPHTSTPSSLRLLPAPHVEALLAASLNARSLHSRQQRCRLQSNQQRPPPTAALSTDDARYKCDKLSARRDLRRRSAISSGQPTFM